MRNLLTNILSIFQQLPTPSTNTNRSQAAAVVDGGESGDRGGGAVVRRALQDSFIDMNKKLADKVYYGLFGHHLLGTNTRKLDYREAIQICLYIVGCIAVGAGLNLKDVCPQSAYLFHEAATYAFLSSFSYMVFSLVPPNYVFFVLLAWLAMLLTARLAFSVK